MAVETVADRAAMMADFGIESFYTPVSTGQPVAALVIFSRENADTAGVELGLALGAWTATVLREKVPVDPARGDIIEASAVRWRVRSAEPDAEGVFWRLSLERLP